MAAKSTDRHRPGYHAEREAEDKKIRKAAKVVEWDDDLERKAKRQREKWRHDLAGFMKNVMPNSCPLEFSKWHLSMIEKMQGIILNGGKTADALPRGSGKTTISTGAFIWAILYGHLRYGAVIGNEGDAAKAILESVKIELWLGEGIGKYWPKLQEYIQRGDGQSQKYRHLLNSDQSPPLIKWGIEQIRLPSTPKEEGDEWSGAILHACGITGRIRGMFMKMDDGTILRPDFVLIDDPQTRESAKSETQIDDRESTITGDIGGLGGPGKTVATFMAMTVIYPNDLACRFLDAKKHPSWKARKVPMLITWPDEKEGLWEEYNIIRKTAQLEDKGREEPDDFYRLHKDEMDAGAEVYWEERKFPEDISALQHAMNLYFDDPSAFLAEFQNEPIEHTGGAPYILEPTDVMKATNGLPRLEAPEDALIISSFTDINYSGLNTVVMASTNNAVCYIIDYLTYPGNGKVLYKRPERGQKIEAAEQLAIASGLSAHIPHVAAQRYKCGDRTLSPELILIDCGFNMDLVFRWCRQNRHRVGARLYPSAGRGFSKYRLTNMVGTPGDNFHVADWQKRGRVLIHNADQWRMRTQKGFLMPPGTPGSISIYGANGIEHNRFAKEVCCESLKEYIEMSEGGNEYFLWKKQPGISNDLGDATVGARVGVAWLGASVTGLGAVPSGPQKQKARRKARTRIKI